MALQPEEKSIAMNLVITIGVLVGVAVILAFFSMHLASMIG